MSTVATVSGKSYPGTKVFADTRNCGQLGPNDPWDVANSQGDYLIESTSPINSSQPIRQILPAGVVQTSPANGMGIHVTVPLGGVVVASFTNQTSSPPLPIPIPNPTPAPSALVIGVNGSGVHAPENDPVLHPQILTAMAGLGATTFRLWGTDALNAAPGPEQWVIPLKFAKAGINVTYEINTQNAASGTKDPTLADLTKWLDGVPAPAVTGVHAFEFSNEEDNPGAYSNESVQQFSDSLDLVFQKLTAKGYKVYCGNPVFNLTFLQQLNAIKPLSQRCNGTGIHAYLPTASGVLGWIKQTYDYLTPIGVPLVCTEVGLHSASGGWPSQLPPLYAGAKAMAVPMELDIFCLLESNASGGTPGGILDPNYQTNANYTAIKAGLGR